MAALPSPTQVSGYHNNLYETYYYQLEKNGKITAIDAARFLKKSGLPDALLGKVWDLSDPSAKGYLNKVGFFVALKLVSLAQHGHEVSIGNLLMEVPPPKMEGSYVTIPAINSVTSTANDWSMKPSERAKYEQLFDSLQPLNGVIPGSKVKGMLIDSKLPVSTLGKIWDLADMDKDGSLDKHEFIVAMHLVYKALEKYAIPSSLPPELLPPTKKESNLVATNHKSQMPNGTSIIWVVSPEEKAQYDNLFHLTDVDKDGYVSGPEIKNVFLQSGVPQTILANIWSLCDMKQSGKLNSEQFALAMWLIQQKLKGVEPPQSLPPEMIPPSFRTNKTYTNENNNAPYNSTPELDMITKDIEELMQEKQSLESEILQKEADIKIKMGEAKSLQGELDTLAATLKQLENQKGEAQKRLNDLKNQSLLVEKELNEIKLVIDLEQEQVGKLKKQSEEHEALVKAQEDELNCKKQELEELKAEESKLEAEQNKLVEKLTSVSDSLQDSQLNISQIKTKMSQLQEYHIQLKEAIVVIDNALKASDVSSLSGRILDLEAEFRDNSYTRLINSQQEDKERRVDPFNANANSKNNSFISNTFSNDHFASVFEASNTQLKFNTDPFSSFSPNAGPADPFDPFGTSGSNQVQDVPDGEHDPFGCEPFGNTAPALPPKNKQPPPRPAPPRPSVPPISTQVTSTPDAFADFSNFNTKSDSQNSNLEFTEDPFRDYRYEDPFTNIDPFDDTSSVEEFGVDPFTPVKAGAFQMGRFKSDEQLIDLSKKKNSVLGDTNKSIIVKDKFAKSDSLPSLLS